MPMAKRMKRAKLPFEFMCLPVVLPLLLPLWCCGAVVRWCMVRGVRCLCDIYRRTACQFKSIAVNFANVFFLCVYSTAHPALRMTSKKPSPPTTLKSKHSSFSRKLNSPHAKQWDHLANWISYLHLHLQQGPQDGVAATVISRGGRVGADQNAQSSAVGVQSFACEFLQVEHLESDPGSGSLNLTECQQQLSATAAVLLAATDTIYNS